MGRTCTVKSDLFLVLLNKSIASRCRCSSRNSNFYFSPPLPLIVYIASSFSFRVPPWHSSSESCTSVIMSTLTGDARTLAATTDSQIESALKRILSPRRITRLVGWSTLFFLFFLIFYSLFWTVRTGWHFVVRYYGPSIKREPQLCFILFLYTFRQKNVIIFFLVQTFDKVTGEKKQEKKRALARLIFIQGLLEQSNGLQSGFWHLGFFPSFSRPLIPSRERIVQ